MNNRRVETRKKLMAFTPVHTDGGVLLGYLENLTLQGSKVVGEKPLEINSQVTLAIDLPGKLAGVSARQMTIKARVASCVPDEESQVDFNIGFEFIGVEPEHAKIIQALLDRYHFRYQG